MPAQYSLWESEFLPSWLLPAITAIHLALVWRCLHQVSIMWVRHSLAASDNNYAEKISHLQESEEGLRPD